MQKLKGEEVIIIRKHNHLLTQISQDIVNIAQ